MINRHNVNFTQVRCLCSVSKQKKNAVEKSLQFFLFKKIIYHMLLFRNLYGTIIIMTLKNELSLKYFQSIFIPGWIEINMDS